MVSGKLKGAGSFVPGRCNKLPTPVVPVDHWGVPALHPSLTGIPSRVVLAQQEPGRARNEGRGG